MPPEAPLLRASEIGQYVYCARAWWLGQVKGVPSAHREEMAAGKFSHLLHGKAITQARRWRAVAWGFSLAAALMGLLLIWTLIRG